jgi:AmiR/NasT family two-component response regulator
VEHELTVEAEDLEVVVARLLAATGMAQERQAQLQRALDSRVVIEQAKGMLAERLGISVVDAFALLRSAARSSRVRVHDVAQALVTRDPRFDELLARGRRR